MRGSVDTEAPSGQDAALKRARPSTHLVSHGVTSSLLSAHEVTTHACHAPQRRSALRTPVRSLPPTLTEARDPQSVVTGQTFVCANSLCESSRLRLPAGSTRT